MYHSGGCAMYILLLVKRVSLHTVLPFFFQANV